MTRTVLRFPSEFQFLGFYGTWNRSFFLRRWVAWSWNNNERSNISDFSFNDRSFSSSVTIKTDTSLEFSKVQVSLRMADVSPRSSSLKDVSRNVPQLLWRRRNVCRSQFLAMKVDVETDIVTASRQVLLPSIRIQKWWFLFPFENYFRRCSLFVLLASSEKRSEHNDRTCFAAHRKALTGDRLYYYVIIMLPDIANVFLIWTTFNS